MPTIETTIYYGEHEPADALRPWVAAYWHFRVDCAPGSVVHTVPPDGSVSVWWPRGTPGLGLTGPHLEPLQTEVHEGDVLWGARFWPGAAAPFVEIAPTELRNRRIAPGEFAPNWTADLRDRLAATTGEADAAKVWDQFLAPVADGGQSLDAAVMAAVFAIIRAGGTGPISELAHHQGLSPRQLRRRFRRAVGLSPKELARVRRIRSSLVGVVQEERVPWIDLADAYGYADQAHLIREYRRVVGLAPEALRSHLSRIAHGRLIDV